MTHTIRIDLADDVLLGMQKDDHAMAAELRPRPEPRRLDPSGATGRGVIDRAVAALARLGEGLLLPGLDNGGRRHRPTPVTRAIHAEEAARQASRGRLRVVVRGRQAGTAAPQQREGVTRCASRSPRD